MATELDNRCPICLDSWEEASYVMPCLHRFCYGCIHRWAESKPECPLCKRRILSIVHFVQEDNDFEEQVITLPAAPSVISHQLGGAPGRAAAHSPAAAEQEPVGMELLSTSSAAHHGGPSNPHFAPVPTHGDQEEPQEDPEEAVPGPSPSSWGSEGFPGGPRRPPKRRASSTEASSPARKRPSRQQH